jgi:hypothetical protein
MASSAARLEHDPFSGASPMNANNERLEPPDLSHFHENRNKIPREEWFKYAGKHVAFSPDGTRIVASGNSIEEVDAILDAAGIPVSQVVHSYIDPPDVSYV